MSFVDGSECVTVEQRASSGPGDLILDNSVPYGDPVRPWTTLSAPCSAPGEPERRLRIRG
jgi:hypothetical protein